MSSPFDLVSMSTALLELTGSLPADTSALSNVITAASYAIRRWTSRDFVLRTYDELYDGKGYTTLLTRQFPIVGPLARLAVNPTDVLTVRNTDSATNQEASAALASMGDVDYGQTPVGIALSRTASGVVVNSNLFFGTPPNTFLTLSTDTTGSLSAGTYLASFSLVSGASESATCSPLPVAVSASGTVTWTLPALPANATGFNVYLSQANGSTLTRQNGATPVTSGTYTASSYTAGASPATASNVTVQSVADAINGLGNGWQATVATGYGLWATADLRAVQGSSDALGGATFQVHTQRLTRFTVDANSGLVHLNNTGFDPAFYALNVGGSPGAFPVGFQNVRVVYTAGYPVVPPDVQQACLIAVQDWMADLSKSRVFKSETFKDYSYQFFEKETYGLPAQSKGLLQQYRAYRRP